jgi:glutamate-1-semialdehyde 2,1-aminomutase
VPSTKLEQAGSYENLAAADAALMPGRKVTHLVFGDPQPNCAFGPGNEFVAREARKNPAAAALMMVHPAMSAEEVEGIVRRQRFLGFKPYLYYATGGDIWNARITEFMPEHQLAVANRYGLMIGMHLSKSAGIADRDNLNDLERLTAHYPRVRWVLFHNARSYSAWPIERAASRLRNIPNLWYEGSSVCETDAFDAAFSLLDPKRYCYGTDDFPVGVTRGKYIAWGHGWAEMNLSNQSLSIGHCDGRFSFVRYEMLRAMRRAARHASFTPAQIEDIFYGNGASLVAAVRRDLNAALGG